MIVSEGDTIKLRVKFEPQEEETFVNNMEQHVGIILKAT